VQAVVVVVVVFPVVVLVASGAELANFIKRVIKILISASGFQLSHFPKNNIFY
jgi:hypothetical protein